MIVLYDTREKTPWKFDFYDCEVEEHCLKTGDYSIKGKEDLVCIERKKSTGELSINIGLKWKPFNEELTRMSGYRFKFLICEFPIEYLDQFPKNSGIPKRMLDKLRITPQFLKKRLFDTCYRNEIELIFCSSREEAERKVYEILKAIDEI